MTAASILGLLLWTSSAPVSGADTATTGAGEMIESDLDEGAAIEDEAADEREALFIESIELIGNTKTERSVILRRLSLGIGDLADDEKIDESRLRLLATGYFKSVEFSLQRGSRRGRVVLVIEVEERNTILIDGIYLGRSSVTPFFAGLQLSENNFFGRGMSVALGAAAGRARRALDLQIYVPDLSDTPLGLITSLKLVQAAEPLDPADPTALELAYTRAGGTLGIVLGIGPSQRVSLRYRLESIQADRLPNLDPAVLRGAPSLQFDESILSTVSLNYERDTRDHPFVPTRGGRVALAVEVGSKIIASTYEFSKYTAELELAFSPVANHALRLKVFGGLIQGQTPFFNQFFVRDFSHFDFGGGALPRVLEVNFSDFTDYDDLVLSGGADYSIPLISGGDAIYRAYVYGGINVSATASLDELQEDIGGRGPRGRVPISFDLGVRFDTWIGQFTVSGVYLLDLVL